MYYQHFRACGESMHFPNCLMMSKSNLPAIVTFQRESPKNWFRRQYIYNRKNKEANKNNICTIPPLKSTLPCLWWINAFSQLSYEVQIKPTSNCYFSKRITKKLIEEVIGRTKSFFRDLMSSFVFCRGDILLSLSLLQLGLIGIKNRLVENAYLIFVTDPTDISV